MPRYGSTSCDGNGRTDRSTAFGASPSSAARKNLTSAVATSRSASLASTYNTTPFGRAWAAAATCRALADGVSPETDRADESIPLRETAVFRIARRCSDVDAGTILRHAGLF